MAANWGCKKILVKKGFCMQKQWPLISCLLMNICTWLRILSAKFLKFRPESKYASDLSPATPPLTYTDLGYSTHAHGMSVQLSSSVS
jgi:hypothetical protein